MQDPQNEFACALYGQLWDWLRAERASADAGMSQETHHHEFAVRQPHLRI